MSTEPEPLAMPDPERADEVFRDGPELYEVQVLPAAFPVKGLHDDGPTPWDFGMTIALLLFIFVVGGVGYVFDRRWKVVVSRRYANRRSPWVVVNVEFFSSSDLANEKRVVMLREWRPSQFSTALPMSSSELRRARRQSKRA